MLSYPLPGSSRFHQNTSRHDMQTLEDKYPKFNARTLDINPTIDDKGKQAASALLQSAERPYQTRTRQRRPWRQVRSLAADERTLDPLLFDIQLYDVVDGVINLDWVIKFDFKEVAC